MSAKPLQLGTTNTGSLSFLYFAAALGSRTLPFPAGSHKSPHHAPTSRNATPTAFLEMLSPWKKNRTGGAAARGQTVFTKRGETKEKKELPPFFTSASLPLFLASLFPSL
jgi:hypothetical protein